MNHRVWYSVKCIFEHNDLAHEAEATVYEERIVILRAIGFDDAITQGEAEAQEYVAGIGNDSIGYTGFISAYRTGEDELAERMEVYSLMRETTLSREDFLTQYYDDGSERTQVYADRAEQPQ